MAAFQAHISRIGFIGLAGTPSKSSGTPYGAKKREKFGTPGGRANDQAKVCGNNESNPGGPIGGSWDRIWSPGDLRGPQKGNFWAKISPFGDPGVP